MNVNNFLIWSDEFSVGLEEIDNDHKEILFSVRNLLNVCDKSETCVSKEDKDESFEKMIITIKNLFQNHFAREEKLMQDNNYPQYEDHKIKHDDLMANVNKIMDQVNYEKQNMSQINITIFLREWFVEHIFQKDKQMIEYIGKLSR